MNNRMNNNFPQEKKSTKQRVLETGPAVIGTIFLLLGFVTENYTLRLIFLFIAAGIGVFSFLFMLIREIANRIRNKKNR